jgi:ribonucleoside-diphosphate reductase alpha chain
MSQFTNDLSKEIYESTYRYGDETIEETQHRVAYDIASVELDRDFWTSKFKEILTDFKFVPGGRILSNAGIGLKGTTYINCFVDGFVGKDPDSMNGISNALARQAQILKSEGGYGFCADVMRPRGGFIDGIANETPGAVRMLDMWNTQSDVITAGSGKKSDSKKSKQKIRKGAQMVTMSCWHPDIEEFITAKQTSGRLDKFNMSLLITDDFMNAVLNNSKWDLIFPDFDKVKGTYEDEWDGNINKWLSDGHPVEVYKTYKNANELWDLVMKSTYNRNEPGVLFIDTINRFNNLHYLEYISATNPCGEQILPVGGVCLLGSLNLTQFIKGDDWDYNKLKEIIPLAIRFMDNVNDLTYVPLQEQKDNLKKKRRIGLGIMGYGSALLMMKIRYGGKQALEMTEKLMNFIANTTYQSSALLAKEKGYFPLYQEEKYLKSKFIENLSDETKELIKKYGIRNSHLLSIQPTGNSSVLSNVVSGGLEPVFLFEYIRTVIQSFPPEGLQLPQNIDWAGLSFVHDSEPKWEWVKEGDENMLKTVFDGNVYKMDKGRGLLKESHVIDYGVRHLEEIGEWDANAEWAANINSLKIDEHVETMKVMSKYIDSSMSKTINISNDYPYEDFKNVYLEIYKSGTIKGGTTYRAGTMATVLKEKETKSETVTVNNVPKRPLFLDCDVIRFTSRGNKWVGFVGLDSRDSTWPYEIFTGLADDFVIPSYVDKGQIRKEKIKDHEDNVISRYDFIYHDKDGFKVTMQGLNRAFDREFWNVGKLLSGLLRHHIHLPSVIKIIDSLKLDGDTLGTWKKGVTRILKRYIKEGEMPIEEQTCPSCGSRNLIHKEGCVSCGDCQWSRC